MPCKLSFSQSWIPLEQKAPRDAATAIADYRRQVVDLCLNLELGDQIELTGEISDDELLARYRSARGIVLNSRDETAPVVIS